MGMKLKMNQLNLKLTPGDACAKLKANDPSMHTCDLSNNAVMQARAPHRSCVVSVEAAQQRVARRAELILRAHSSAPTCHRSDRRLVTRR